MMSFPLPASPSRTVALWLSVVLTIAFTIPRSARGQNPSQLSERELEARVAELFGRSCVQSGCHAGPVPQMGMDLSPGRFYASTVAQASTERPELMRVNPGAPENSYLVMKIRGHPDIVGAPMPFMGNRLTEEEMQTIEAWISSIQEVDSTRRHSSASEVAYPFTGWKVINLPTTRSLDAGSWLFLISHRFNPKISDGYDAFFGLDGSAIINLSLGYAPTDRLLVALARSNAADDVEISARYNVAHQGGERGWPIGAAFQGAVNWITEDVGDDVDVERFKFTGQVSLTREIGGRLGLAAVPSILFNPDELEEGENPLIALGLGTRWNFYRNLALVGEWIPILSGYTRTRTFGNINRFDTWGGGLEIATGGHVFQIVVTNSVGLATDQYLRGGDLDIRDGDMRLGFNIFRILNF